LKTDPSVNYQSATAGQNLGIRCVSLSYKDAPAITEGTLKSPRVQIFIQISVKKKIFVEKELLF